MGDGGGGFLCKKWVSCVVRAQLSAGYLATVSLDSFSHSLQSASCKISTVQPTHQTQSNPVQSRPIQSIHPLPRAVPTLSCAAQRTYLPPPPSAVPSTRPLPRPRPPRPTRTYGIKENVLESIFQPKFSEPKAVCSMRLPITAPPIRTIRTMAPSVKTGRSMLQKLTDVINVPHTNSAITFTAHVAPKIKYAGDPVLHRPARPVDSSEFGGPLLKEIEADMRQIMASKELGPVGLAANQVYCVKFFLYSSQRIIILFNQGRGPSADIGFAVQGRVDERHN